MGWAEIKKAINSDLTKPLNTLITEVKTALESILNGKASQTSVDSLSTTLSTKASQSSLDTKASQTSVTEVQTTANTINTNVSALLGGRNVKSVQRGYFNGYSTKTPAGVLINHNAVDLNKSLLFVSGFKENYTGSGLITKSRSSTNFLMESSSSVTYDFIFSWELIEFY